MWKYLWVLAGFVNHSPVNDSKSWW